MEWIPLNRISSYTVLVIMPFLLKTFTAKFVLIHFIADRV